MFFVVHSLCVLTVKVDYRLMQLKNRSTFSFVAVTITACFSELNRTSTIGQVFPHLTDG